MTISVGRWGSWSLARAADRCGYSMVQAIQPACGVDRRRDVSKIADSFHEFMAGLRPIANA